MDILKNEFSGGYTAWYKGWCACADTRIEAIELITKAIFSDA